MAEQQDIALQTFNELGLTASDKVSKQQESSFENLDFSPQHILSHSSIGASNVTDGSTLLPSVHEEGSTLINSSKEKSDNSSPKKTQERYPTSKPSSRAKNQRNYQVFPGRNRFFCGGRVMTSREYYAFALALILLIAPCALFGVFTCPWIWFNVHIAVPIVYAYLFVLALASMVRTSWTDPGIIPRNLDPSPPLDDFDDRNSFAYGTTLDRRIPVAKKVVVKDHTVDLKYCDTCRIYRPPRSSHCRQCDNCVENEDHHCVWLNNCIGRRNYRPFFIFINTASVLCLYTLAFSIYHVITLYLQGVPERNFLSAVQQAPVSFALIILCFLLMWSVGGLTAYHLYLALSGVTTHEQLRANIMRDSTEINLFTFNSSVRNLAYILCRPTTKSFLRRRKPVEVEGGRQLRSVVTSQE
ncbi:hypothetical protein INT44_004479 [Umbelopsis vinacea]|uniref:Palmitoyltransferase n=1 Tax=Umbelopsis vinacea TaxID=44442 RepID=A0A8H7UPI7_9FUNG|nr:hypothetical protein INT44_004479 [Umbelopsis vinacea]